MNFQKSRTRVRQLSSVRARLLCFSPLLMADLDLPRNAAKAEKSAVARQSAAQLELTLTALLGAEVYNALHQQLISDNSWLDDDHPSSLFKHSPEVGQMFRELLIAESADELAAM